MSLFFLLLSAVPAIEARGASIYFLCSGQWVFVPVTVAINFIAVLLFLKMLDMGRVPNRIESFFRRKAGRAFRRAEKLFERYGNIAIFLLIALPSTGIGSFTGAFIGRSLGLKGRVFYFSVFMGIVMSLAIAFPIAYMLNMLYITC